ncbi:MAG TPA: hypothetical protein VKK79_23845 [Candidatus Lokiarchaeia archaeon]|nr:hypothetical protein [Candidatus Lokiarchaeia archaeon]
MADLVVGFVAAGAIAECLMAAYIGGFLYRQYRQKKLNILLLWAFSFWSLVGSVAFILAGILIPIFTGLNEFAADLLFSVGIILLIIMLVLFLAFLIFLEYGQGRQLLFHMTFTGLVGGVFVGLILSPTMFRVKSLAAPDIIFISMDFPALLVGGILVLYAMLLFSKVFGRILRENRGSVLGTKFAYITIGALIHTGSLLLMQVWGVVANMNGIGLFFPYPGVIGLIILVKGLRIHPQYLIYLKEKVNRLIVFQAGGEVLYTYRFRPFSPVEEMYVTAALVGVAAFLQNTLGTGEQGAFRTIDVVSYKIICEFEGKLGFALITTEDSPVLRQALRNVVHQFKSHNVLTQQSALNLIEFQQQVLPTLNGIVEDVFFFYPEQPQAEEA